MIPSHEPDDASVGILYLVGHFMLGGTERHVLRVLEGIDRSRIRPYVGTLKIGGTWFETFRRLEVPHHLIGLEAPVIDPRYLPRLARLAAFIRRHRIRIVHAYGWETQMLACALRLMCPWIRLIGTRRTLAELEPTHHIEGYRLTTRFFNRIIAVSESARRSSILAEGLDPERIGVIPNGIELQGLPVRRPPEQAQPLRIGTVANVKRRKGYFWALRGLAELARRGVDFEYRVIGRDDTGGELEREARELGIADKIRFRGELPRPLDELIDLHVFLFPTYNEGMSNALLEAMAIGTPIVATRVPGNVDLIRDGQEGLLVAVDDPSGLADRLEWAAAHGEEMEQLGRQARQRVEQSFTLEHMLDSMDHLYSEVLSC